MRFLFYNLDIISFFQECYALFHFLVTASVCMAIYRSQFIPEETIAYIPARGYSRGNKYSKASIEWLEFEAAQRKCKIRHALNDIHGEYRVPGTRWTVDGFIPPTEDDSHKGTIFRI